MLRDKNQSKHSRSFARKCTQLHANARARIFPRAANLRVMPARNAQLKDNSQPVERRAKGTRQTPKPAASREKEPMTRTNISVDHGIFEEFSLEAKRQDKSLSAFANESLSTMARISAGGGNPPDLYRLWTSVALMKQFDAITLPSDFVDDLIAEQYAVDKEKLLSKFRSLGSRLVVVLKIAAEDLNELARLASDFAWLLPLKQFKITRVSDGETIEIGVVGAGRKIESTECSFEFLQSILSGYGWTVTKHELGVGTIRAWASKRSSKW